MIQKLIIFTSILALAYSAPVAKSNVNEEEIFHGRTATLSCLSNDKDHVFYAWELPNGDMIGPETAYNETKYDYEVLTGNLIIKKVSMDQQGVYACLSRGLRNNDLKTRRIRMVVRKEWEDVWEHDKSVNYFRVIVVIGSVFLIIVGIYYVYRLVTDKHRLPSYLEPSDEEDSGEEIFSAPGTSKTQESTNLFDKPSTSKYDKLIDDK